MYPVSSTPGSLVTKGFRTSVFRGTLPFFSLTQKLDSIRTQWNLTVGLCLSEPRFSFLTPYLLSLPSPDLVTEVTLDTPRTYNPRETSVVTEVVVWFSLTPIRTQRWEREDSLPSETKRHTEGRYGSYP